MQSLRRANPVPEDTTKGWSTSAEGRRVAVQVKRELSDDLTATPPRSRRSRVAAAAIAAAALLALGGAIVIVSRPTVTPLSAGCFEQLDQSANVAIVFLRGRDPADACAARWMEQFGVRAPARLTTCVLDAGGTGVFPYPDSMTAEDACSSLGAGVLQSGPGSP